MILKIKHGNNWTFVDGVENVTKIMNSELEPSEFISYERQGALLTQNISEGCYLLNNEGKTIERIA